jgi:transposase
MFIIKRKTENPEYTRVLIAENYREKGKIKQRILRKVGVAHNQRELENYERIAVLMIEEEVKKKNKSDLLLNYSVNLDDIPLKDKHITKLNSDDVREIKRVDDGIPTVYCDLFDSLGFNNILGNKNHSEILKQLVSFRISEPKSKLKSQEILSEKWNINFSLSSIYRMLDSLAKAEDKVIQTAFNATKKLFPEEKIDVLFFDVTTLYFESIEQEEELKAFGFSKDCKFNQVQVVLALATTHEGLPIGYKVFKGNTAETKTLIVCVEEWRKIIAIENVVFVADRAMFSKSNLYELDQAGFIYIVAAKLRSLSVENKNNVLSENDYKITENQGEVVWKKELKIQLEHKIKLENKNKVIYLPCRLISTYSSTRAKKDRKDRDRQIEKINKCLNKETKSAPTKKMVTNACLKKYCKFEGNSASSLDELKIQNDELWDGMHGIITNSNKPSAELLARYHDLWQIEATFRLTKSDLKIRPIYHYKPSRIRGHIALCFISLTLMRHLQYNLLRQNIKISMQKLNEELRKIQYSICKDAYTGLYFKIPAAQTPLAKQIYSALGIKRKEKVTFHKQPN